MSPPSAPESDDPDDIARWQEDQRAWRERVAKEDEFRDTMIRFAERTDTTLTHIKAAQEKHDADDARRFRAERRARKRLERRVDALGGQVTQTVNTNKYNWGVVAVWVSAFVTVAASGWALYQTFGGMLKP